MALTVSLATDLVTGVPVHNVKTSTYKLKPIKTVRDRLFRTDSDHDSAYESASSSSASSSGRSTPRRQLSQIQWSSSRRSRRASFNEPQGLSVGGAPLHLPASQRSRSCPPIDHRMRSARPVLPRDFSGMFLPSPTAVPGTPADERARSGFQTPEAVERDLILPTLPTQQIRLPGLPLKLDPSEVGDEAQAQASSSSSGSDVSTATPPEEKQIAEKAHANWFAVKFDEVRQIYAPNREPELVLPTAPTDEEKLCYLHTNRAVLYSAGLFSFFSLCTGMWLFTISSPYLAWFGVFAGALQIYMGISYWVGLVGRDWDYEGHQKIIAETPIDPLTCPTVDIYLPICKEPIEILRNTWEHVKRLDWPADKLKVYVLDDGAMKAVEEMASSFGFEYIVREDRPRLKKAGNLRWAFTRTYGEFFNIYDADFCPRPDFLKETVPRMVHDPKIAIVQTPQFFRTTDKQTWVEQGAGAVQELFYRVVQVNRDRWGASICVGSNALYRRSALEAVGGTAEIGFSEDVHTGFYAVDRGWKVKYMPLNLACGVCPDSPRAFFSQQMRWCMGSTTLLSNPDFWKSKLTKMQKFCYLCGMMYYSAMALSIFLNPIPGTVLIWLRPDYFKFYNLAFAVPSLLFTIVAIRCWAKASYGFNVQHIMVIQNYAYLTTIKDKILGRGLAWVPTGDGKAHKSNKYRNMRILAWCWLISWFSVLMSGIIYQVIHGLHFYHCIPVLCLDAFNIYLAHRFLFLSY